MEKSPYRLSWWYKLWVWYLVKWYTLRAKLCWLLGHNMEWEGIEGEVEEYLLPCWYCGKPGTELGVL